MDMDMDTDMGVDVDEVEAEDDEALLLVPVLPVLTFEVAGLEADAMAAAAGEASA